MSNVLHALLVVIFLFLFPTKGTTMTLCVVIVLFWWSLAGVRGDCVLSSSSFGMVLQERREKWRITCYICCLSSFSFIYFCCAKDDDGNVIVVFLFLVQRRWWVMCCMRYARHLLSFFSIAHYYHDFLLFFGKRIPMALCRPLLVQSCKNVGRDDK
jgi:hypothetical protein